MSTCRAHSSAIEKGRLQAQITLTPGVAVFPIVMAEIDADADGAISEAEAAGVCRAGSPRFVDHDRRPSLDAPIGIDPISEDRRDERRNAARSSSTSMRICLAAAAAEDSIFRKSSPKPDRSLPGELSRPSRPARFGSSARSATILQSHYQLDYVDAGVLPNAQFFTWWSADRGWLAALALALFARFALIWRGDGKRISNRL